MALKAQQVEFLISANPSLAGGSATFYTAGSSHADADKKAIWQDRNKTTPSANPVTLDAVNGTAVVFGDGVYDVVLKTAAGAALNIVNLEIASKTSTTFYDVALDFGGDLVAALGSPLTAGKTVVVSTVVTCSSDTTRPADRQIKIERGGRIDPSSGITFDWNKGIPDAGLYQVFGGAGKHNNFGGTHLLVEWWGASASTANNAPAINAAILAAYEPETWQVGGPPVMLTGMYPTTASVYMRRFTRLLGVNEWQSGIKAAGAITALIFERDSSYNASTAQVSDISIAGYDTAGSTGMRLGSSDSFIGESRIRNVRIRDFETGIDWRGAYSMMMENVYVESCTGNGITMRQGTASPTSSTLVKCGINDNGGWGVEFTRTGVTAKNIQFEGGGIQYNALGEVNLGESNEVGFSNVWFESNKSPKVIAVKAGASRYTRFDQNCLFYGYSYGIWSDERVYDLHIENARFFSGQIANKDIYLSHGSSLNTVLLNNHHSGAGITISNLPSYLQSGDTGTGLDADAVSLKSYGKNYIQWLLPLGVYETTLTPNVSNPSVENRVAFVTANTTPTTVSYLDPSNGRHHRITIRVNDNNTTFNFSTGSLKGNSGTNYTAKVGDVLSCINIDGANFYCTIIKAAP